ncbi:MAG: extracellular solute-binding protein, partial [Clostridiales bacterium]|nr:extracellular solute-binding protein [Clostridiales bacterium]
KNMKKTTKLLTILLALVMLVSVMAACTKDEPAADPTDAPKVTEKPAEVTPEPEPEPWEGTISVSSYAWAPMDEDLDIIGPYIEEALLDYDLVVDLEYVYIEWATYTEVINTRLAGGTAPDMFVSYNIDNISALYDQGAIATWTPEFYIENMPNIHAFIEGGGLNGESLGFVDLWWELAMIGDDMVSIPNMSPGWNIPSKDVVYRADWLEALGVAQADLPTTIEGFVALATRMTTEDPDGNGKDDTYGMSESILRAFFGAYGNYNGFIGGTGQWYVDDDIEGNIISGDLVPGNKEVLKVAAELYAAGVLHPEFITRENEGGYWAISHHLVNGDIGMSSHASIDHWRYPSVVGDDGGPVYKEYVAINGGEEETAVVYGPWPSGPDGYFGHITAVGAGVGENALYNATLMEDTEKLAAIFKIVDIFSVDDDLAKMSMWGVEGTHYEMVGTAEAPARKGNFTPAENNVEGIMAYRSLTGGNGPYNATMYQIGLNNPATKNRVEIQKGENFGAYGPRNGGELRISLPSAGDYRAELTTYRDETWIKMITGELDNDYWDTFVTEYNTRGGAILTAEANDWYTNK